MAEIELARSGRRHIQRRESKADTLNQETVCLDACSALWSGEDCQCLYAKLMESNDNKQDVESSVM